MPQISKSSVTAFTHSFANFFKYARLCPTTSPGDSGPHPKTREKSFPVPKGMIPIGQFVISTPVLRNSLTTHMTVPSPPPIIALTGTPIRLRDNFRTSFLISENFTHSMLPSTFFFHVVKVEFNVILSIKLFLGGVS